MVKDNSSSFKAEQYVGSSCWDGNHYSSHSEWQFKMAIKALNLIEISNDSKVLDIGCGDGRVTKYLSSLVPCGEVIGLDPSISMLASAQVYVGCNLSFMQGKAESLPFENKFDFIVAFNSLHWVSETKIALTEIKKALLPGGQALILVAPIQVRHPLHQIINEVARKEKWSCYFNNKSNIFPFLSLAKWANLIEEVGLIPEKLQLLDGSLDYMNKKAFADSLIGWVPFGSIPDEEKYNFIDDIVEAYLETIPCNPNGVVHYLLDELVMLISNPRKS